MRPVWRKRVLSILEKAKKAGRVVLLSFFLRGWEVGFEPTTFGSTIRHSNQLSYAHHPDFEIGCKITNFFRHGKINLKKNCIFAV